MPTDFDGRAATWDDDPSRVERARVVAEAIRRTVPLAGSPRLLEYGAGTGLVSQALADEVGPITLAEPSAGMRAVLEEKIATGALPPDSTVWDLDLTNGAVPEDRFDLVVTVMTLHHIHDVAAVLDGFAALLAAGGHVCIADLEEEDGSFHGDDPHFDGHRGFRTADLAALLSAGGFDGVRVEPCGAIEKEGERYRMFLATAIRAGDG